MGVVTVSPLYAAMLALLILILGYRVTLVRRAEKIPVGDGGSRVLLRAIRAHGNAVENIPIMLILLTLLELDGASPWLLHLLAAPFLLARIAHAYSMSQSTKASPGRFFGVAISWLCLAGLIVANLLYALLKIQAGA